MYVCMYVCVYVRMYSCMYEPAGSIRCGCACLGGDCRALQAKQFTTSLPRDPKYRVPNHHKGSYYTDPTLYHIIYIGALGPLGVQKPQNQSEILNGPPTGDLLPES